MRSAALILLCVLMVLALAVALDCQQGPTKEEWEAEQAAKETAAAVACAKIDARLLKGLTNWAEPLTLLDADREPFNLLNTKWLNPAVESFARKATIKGIPGWHEPAALRARNLWRDGPEHRRHLRYLKRHPEPESKR